MARPAYYGDIYVRELLRLLIIRLIPTQEKYAHLQAILHEMGSVLVAYSGGVDSALLLKVAHDMLGEQAMGAIADLTCLCL